MKISYSILLMIFSVIITSEMVGIYFIYEYKNTLIENIAGPSERLNSILINRIDSYATERLVDVINFADDESFKSAIESSNMEFSKMKDPEQYVNKMDTEWTSVQTRDITPFMKTLIDNQPSNQLRDISKSENTLFNGVVYSEIFITNSYGANVAETDKTTDYKQSDETWWQEARKNGVYIGGIEYGNSSRTASFTVAKRIDDSNGNFLGVVKAVVNVEQIIMFSLTIAVSILVFIASNRIVKPIETIQKAMIDHGNGKIVQITPEGSNETVDLGEHYNQMMKTIEDDKIKIHESANLYKGLFELNPDPIRISTLELVTTAVNQSFLDKFGYSKDEIIGRTIYETIEDSSRKEIDKVLENLRNGKSVENIEVIYHKKDGTPMPVLLSVSLSRDREGKPSGYIAVIKDASEIYEARKKIQENEEKILNQYLKLKQIDELKDEFASMISHELTTPLFPIKFHADMLKDPKMFGKLNKEQNNSINEIYENATQLEKLISDILDVQKLEQRGMKFVKTNFETDEFMSKIEHDNEPMMENKSIKFENATKDKIIVNSDPGRLEQVFSNLIKNAVDFVPEKTGKIEIGTKIDDGFVKFYVKDNGVGIPKEKQINLFKKFYQIDTSIKRKHRGSGLGLSICKGIIEGLGGKIWLESTEGLGTIVYFTIPKGDTT